MGAIHLVVEFVDLDNIVLGPMAQCLAEDYLKQLGQEGINVRSSGVQANRINFDYIQVGLECGIYHGKTQDLAEEIMADRERFTVAFFEGDRETMTMARNCFAYLELDATAKSTLVLLEHGLVPLEFKYGQDHQTRQDIRSALIKPGDPITPHLVLAMNDATAETARRIFTYPDIQVVTIGQYVVLPTDQQEMMHPLGRHIPSYREARNQLNKAVQISLDRAIAEHIR